MAEVIDFLEARKKIRKKPKKPPKGPVTIDFILPFTIDYDCTKCSHTLSLDYNSAEIAKRKGQVVQQLAGKCPVCQTISVVFEVKGDD